jgi:hypothetical protein
VAKEIEDCTTLNLSKAEMEAMGWNKKYAELHGILSKKIQKSCIWKATQKPLILQDLTKYDLIL